MSRPVVYLLLFVGAISCNQGFKKCHPLSGEDANVNLEEAVQSLKNCFLVNEENFKHQVASITSCWGTVQMIEDCEKSIARAVAECGSPDEKFFPTGVFKIIGRYVNFICSRPADYKFPVLLDHKLCYPSLANGLGCYEKFNFFNSTVIVTKDEMCQDQVEVEQCFEEYINSTCIKDELFTKYLKEAFDFESPPCGTDSAGAVTNTLILFCVVVLLSVILQL